MNDININSYNLPEIPTNIDKEEYEYRYRYLKIYFNIISKCINMTEIDLVGYNEVHHILPKCLGGKDSRNNLVTMPVKYHIMVHIVLLKIYPDDLGLAMAVNSMICGSSKETAIAMKNRKLEIVKSFSVRTIAKARADAMTIMKRESSGGKNPNSKTVMSPSGKIYSTIKEAALDNNIPYNTLTKWLAGETDSHGWTYYNSSKTDYSKVQRNTEKSKKSVIDTKTNTEYSSIKEACIKNDVPYTTMRYWLSGRTKDNHGWKFKSSND